MAGGELVLRAVGSQSVNFIGNPQLTFFKIVYKRYAHFSTEPIQVSLDGIHELDFDKGPTLTCTIARHGDLLSNMYLQVDIPDIYSGYDTDNNLGYQFQWIQELGAQMIQTVELSIGGTIIQKLTGSYIQLWHELYSPEDKNINVYYKMTGNTVDMFNPASSPWAKGIYPTSTLDPSLHTDPEIVSTEPLSKIDNPYYKTASINGRTLNIPLPFWFSLNSGQSLPLISLQKHEVQISIQFRPLKELYRVRDTDESSATFTQHIAPQQTNLKHHIQSFLSNTSRAGMQGKENLSFSQTNLTTANHRLYINPRLLCTYVLLDKKERNRFAATNHKYLIEQVYTQTDSFDTNTYHYPLQLNNPTKYIIWYLQHEDVHTRNDWSNYSNWKTSFGVPPYALSAYVPTTNEDIKDYIHNVSLQFSKYNPTQFQNVVSKFDYPNLERNILKKASILFDGNEIFDQRENEFFQYIQPYEHRYKKSVQGVYTYSFSLLPRQFQPSGACDMATVQHPQLHIVTQDCDSSFKYNIHVISVSYNVLEIIGGLGSLQYAN